MVSKVRHWHSVAYESDNGTIGLSFKAVQGEDHIRPVVFNFARVRPFVFDTRDNSVASQSALSERLQLDDSLIQPERLGWPMQLRSVEHGEPALFVSVFVVPGPQ